ncbi:MAG: hypothetical protein ABMB14_21910 [Myxococcota bacterium]
MRLRWLVAIGLGAPSLGCELEGPAGREQTCPRLGFELDATTFAPGDPVTATITLDPQPRVWYTLVIVDTGKVVTKIRIDGSCLVILSAPDPGVYDVEIQADGAMAAHRRITVR